MMRSVRLLDEIDLDNLGEELARVVGSTMHPVHALLGLREGKLE